MALLRLCGVSWCLVAGALASANPSDKAATRPSPAAEHQLEAVFLFNFAQFVDWPAEAFRVPGAPLTIGIAGADPFGSYLDRLVAGERVGGRRLAIRRLAAGDNPAGCQILFLAGTGSRELFGVLARVRGSPVLTVGEAAGFARAGGVIGFGLEGGKLHLTVNLKAASDQGLVISSKLLRLSTIVRTDRD